MNDTTRGHRRPRQRSRRTGALGVTVSAAITTAMFARYQAIALHALKQAECMRAHGITGFPSPGAIDGGLHVPDYTAIGFNPHTLQFQAAGTACGMHGVWQVVWWWPAGDSAP